MMFLKMLKEYLPPDTKIHWKTNKHPVGEGVYSSHDYFFSFGFFFVSLRLSCPLAIKVCKE